MHSMRPARPAVPSRWPVRDLTAPTVNTWSAVSAPGAEMTLRKAPVSMGSPVISSCALRQAMDRQSSAFAVNGNRLQVDIAFKGCAYAEQDIDCQWHTANQQLAMANAQVRDIPKMG